MLKEVCIQKRIKAKEFLKFATAGQKRQILDLVHALRGKKILHVNATSTGGGVVELLSSLVPYLRALGVRNEWYAISPKAGKRFFLIADKLRNNLQGNFVKITPKEWKIYEKVNKKIADDLNKIDYDILVVNDWQPLYAVNYLKSGKPRIYFSHADTSSPQKRAWQRTLKTMKKYSRIIFSNRDFTGPGLPKNKIKVFTPAIDPLTLKQKIVPKHRARRFLKSFGIPEHCPLIVQVSRFDIWKNPLGVIEAFRTVQQTYGQARLVLVGFHEAKDNPDAFAVYRDAAAIASRDPNIFLFFHPRGVKSIVQFTMMTQNAADVVVQNSIKEGFGLVVTEAMWKGKPVIGGPASGIRRQIRNGRNGFIVKDGEQLAKKIIYLLGHAEVRRKIGRAARESVREDFLFPRFVLDHLKVYKSVIIKE